MACMSFKEKTIVNAETLNLTYGPGVISSLTVISCVKLTLSPCISHLSRAEIQPSASLGTRRGPGQARWWLSGAQQARAGRCNERYTLSINSSLICWARSSVV